MPKRRPLLVFLALLMVVMLMAILALMWARPQKVSAIVSFTGYTKAVNQSRLRLAGFCLTNSGPTPVRLRYGIILQAGHTNSVGAPLHTSPTLSESHFLIDPKQACVFFTSPPESPARWQLQVVYLKEGRRVKLWRWYHAKLSGTWLYSLVPRRFKDVSQYDDSAISDWIEQ